jgi:gamma-glutamylcyclotransferase
VDEAVLINYLAYGSNLFPPRLAARIAIAAQRGVVALPGYALTFSKRGRDGSAKCTLESAPSAQAWGAIYSIDAADKPLLDRIEGVGDGYAVHWLDCAGHGTCFIYLATAQAIVRDLLPYDWYKAYVVAGARHHRLPLDYIAEIEAASTIADPNRERAAENFAKIRA